jgi:DNA-binding CsgD family transcriptional regulator
MIQRDQKARQTACDPAPLSRPGANRELFTVARLSPRQLACLHRVALGESSDQIAFRLGLSVHTVNEYIALACSRLGTNRRASAVVIALRFGLIALPNPSGPEGD